MTSYIYIHIDVQPHDKQCAYKFTRITHVLIVDRTKTLDTHVMVTAMTRTGQALLHEGAGQAVGATDHLVKSYMELESQQSMIFLLENNGDFQCD